MRIKLLAAACLVLAIVTGAQGQGDKSAANARFVEEWAAVKKNYPAVALAYARRDAFVNAAGIAKDICALYRVLELAPPPGCGITIGPIGNIGDCFKPKKTTDKSVEMPDADEAAECVRNALKTKAR